MPDLVSINCIVFIEFDEVLSRIHGLSAKPNRIHGILDINQQGISIFSFLFSSCLISPNTSQYLGSPSILHQPQKHTRCSISKHPLHHLFPCHPRNHILPSSRPPHRNPLHIHTHPVQQERPPGDLAWVFPLSTRYSTPRPRFRLPTPHIANIQRPSLGNAARVVGLVDRQDQPVGRHGQQRRREGSRGQVRGCKPGEGRLEVVVVAVYGFRRCGCGCCCGCGYVVRGWAGLGRGLGWGLRGI